MSIAVLVFVVAALADVIAPYGYAEMHPEDMLQAPSGKYLLGTDQMGRDVLSRVIYGSRISIYVGVVSTIFGGLAGVLLGIVAAYYGGAIDNALMRLIDIWVAFPNFLLALVISVILGPSVTNVVIALAIVRVPTQARGTGDGALGQRKRLCPGCQSGRRTGSPSAPTAHPAQLHGPCHRPGNARGGHGDHCGGGVELLRVGHAAAHTQLGLGFAGQRSIHRG